MVKKKSLLQKAISFVTSAVMVLTMGTIMPQTNTVKAATTISVTGEEIADQFLAYVGEDYYVNMCLAFVAHVFEDMGASFSSSCCAWNYSNTYLDSTSRDIPIGADVFFSSTGCEYNVKDNSGHDCGHIGVYVGDGYMVHAYAGEIVKMKVSTVESHGYTYLGWGVHGNVELVEEEPVVPAALSSITINPDSIGTIYEDGSTFDSSALSLTATYSDGSTKEITSGYSVTSPSLANVGTQTLTVTYEGKTATLDVTVQDLFEGSGTESDPYLIGTDEDLKNVADMVNNIAANDCYGKSYYKQTADIDLGLYDWTPIGNYTNSETETTFHKKAVFKGHYDGNYHKVTNLKVNYNLIYAGLFGRLNYNVDGAVVENLSVSGDVTGGQSSVGGIVGEAGYGAVIRNCDFTGTVNGTTQVGGIVGKAHQGTVISECYANAEVTAADGCAGGISGTAAVAGSAYSTDVLIKNCYFTGKLSGTTIGGIAGTTEIGTANDTTITFMNSYYLNSAATGAVAGAAQSGCMGLISSQLKTIAADLGSPFADNPYSTLNDGYPVFEWQLDIEGDVNADGQFTVDDWVMLQKWLLCTQDASLTNWQAGDLCADGRIDAFDLAVMKRKLLAKS